MWTFAFTLTFRSSSSRERGGDRDRGDRDRDRFDRFGRSEGREGRDDRSSQNQISKRSFSRESQERSGRGGDNRASTEPVRRVASMTDDRANRDRGSRDRGSRDRGSRDRGPNKELTGEKTCEIDCWWFDLYTEIRRRGMMFYTYWPFPFFSAVKRESAPTPPPSLPKATLTEEEVEKKSNAILEEYLHINDLKV